MVMAGQAMATAITATIHRRGLCRIISRPIAMKTEDFGALRAPSLVSGQTAVLLQWEKTAVRWWAGGRRAGRRRKLPYNAKKNPKQNTHSGFLSGCLN